MVMEFIHGKSLKQYLQEKNAPLSEEETLKIIIPVLHDLEKLHEAEYIHRDVSPNTIILGGNKKVYLTGYDAICRITDRESERVNVIMQTGYTPFEQYHSHGKMGPWTDIYAVCATMYRMMSGKKPQESVARVLDDQVKPLFKLAKRGECPSVSWSTSHVVEKGMNLKCEKRYHNIGELLEDLY